MLSSVCRVCLSSNMKGYHIENTYLQETYEKLTGIMLSTAEGRPSTICYFCNSQLRKSLRFFNMCQKSEKILEDLLNCDFEITQEALAKHNLGWIHNLTVAAFTPVCINNLNIDNINTAKKTETAEEIFINIDPKQYVDVEVSSDSWNKRRKINDSKVNLERKLNNVRLYNCDICHKAFRHKHVLKIHMGIHSGAKPFACDICQKSFSQACNLTKHMISHTGEKPYPCKTCNRSFGHKYTLQLHMRTHTGEKPFTCMMCGRSFSENGKLKRHNMQVHTGQKPYTCSVCHKSFNDNSSLRCHIRLHTGEKLYTCNVCGKSFGQNSTLTRHMRIHTDKKPYSCTVCGRSYTQNSSLSTHRKTHLEYRNLEHCAHKYHSPSIKDKTIS